MKLCLCACMLQGAQGASLPLVARLIQEIPTWKPTLLINNGDIAYARSGTAPCVAAQLQGNPLCHGHLPP